MVRIIRKCTCVKSQRKKLILKRKSNIFAQQRVVTIEIHSWLEHREQPSVLESSLTNRVYIAQLLPMRFRGHCARRHGMSIRGRSWGKVLQNAVY